MLRVAGDDGSPLGLVDPDARDLPECQACGEEILDARPHLAPGKEGREGMPVAAFSGPHRETFRHATGARLEQGMPDTQELVSDLGTRKTYRHLGHVEVGKRCAGKELRQWVTECGVLDLVAERWVGKAPLGLEFAAGASARPREVGDAVHPRGLSRSQRRSTSDRRRQAGLGGTYRFVFENLATPARGRSVHPTRGTPAGENLGPLAHGNT